MLAILQWRRDATARRFAVWMAVGTAFFLGLAAGSRGAAVPILVVFLGAIGGFVAMGIIGLFVGAIVLSVGYKLFLAWLEPAPASEAP
jgi:hypothetical protein